MVTVTNEVSAWFRSVATTTKVRSAELFGPIFSAIVASDPLITSVKRIGADSYPSGHVIIVFGLAKYQENLTPAKPFPILVLNSAVKTPSKELTICDAGGTITDERLSAQLSLTDDYELKEFDGLGSLHMRIRRK